VGKVNPTVEEVREFAKSAPTGPVAMLNLMRFKSGTDPQLFFTELAKFNAPFLERAKAEVLYRAEAGPDFAGNETWDIAVLVQYPSFAAFSELVTDPAWVETAGALRQRSLEDAKLIVTFPPSAS
jgi:hypothetical protein